MSRIRSRFGVTCSVGFALAAFAGPVAAQLKDPSTPPENPVTPEKRILGKALFWEEQLSSDGTMACGTCHFPGASGADPRSVPRAGLDGILGTEDDVYGSPGIARVDAGGNYEPDPEFGFDPQVTGRLAPSVLLAAYFDELFWDGRAGTTFVDPETGDVSIKVGGALETQSLHPLFATGEMAAAGRDFEQLKTSVKDARPLALASDLPGDLQQALAGEVGYPELFERAFGDPEITLERIAYALATYQRTLVPDQSGWDKYRRGNDNALSRREKEGMVFFFGAGRCSICHPPPLFTDGKFHNIGVRPIEEDMGRQAVTGDPLDRGRFKTPSLRNVELRSRFVHNGRFDKLMPLIDMYRRGGDFHDNIDPEIIPLDLERSEGLYIGFFIEGALTDRRAADERGPFSRPTLNSETLVHGPWAIGEGSAGTGGIVPDLLARTPANLGNEGFKVGLRAGLGGAPAILAWSPRPAPPDQLNYGFPVHLELSDETLLIPFQLAGVGAGEGYATFSFDVPRNPGLVGEAMYYQWFVLDPAGGNWGIAASDAVGMEVF